MCFSIKPLEWGFARRNGDWQADCIVGEYAVGQIGKRYVAILRYVKDGQDHDEELGSAFAGHVDAKAACQADYETRIRSALEGQPGVRVTEEMVEAAIAGYGAGITTTSADKMRAALTAALTASIPDSGEGPTHRHKKRGTEYVLIGFGKMQAEGWLDLSQVRVPKPPYDVREVGMREVAIYRSVDDGSLWVRPREEFEDGRFEPHPVPE